MPSIQIDEKLITFLIFLPLFFISLAVHEFAHAFFANKLGDDTAKNEGRLTLNPLKHIDIVGSIVMPVLAFASGFAIIGWAKPVPVDRRKFRNPLMDDAKVSAAGPISNLLLSFLFFLAMAILLMIGKNTTIPSLVFNVLWFAVYLNLFLFAFNLLPIPPLDGSHILFDFFPNKLTAKYLNLGLYGSFILILFIYSPLWSYFSKFINLLMRFYINLFGLG